MATTAFRLRLYKGLRYLGLATIGLWGWIWRFAKWVIENVLGNVVTARLEAMWDALPDAPVVVSALARSSQDHPVGSAVVIACAVVVVTFVWALIDSLRHGGGPQTTNDETEPTKPIQPSSTLAAIGAMGGTISFHKGVNGGPSVLLTFDSPSLRHFKADDVEPVPLGVHNEGNPSALRVRFEPVEFHDTLRMQISEIPMVGPYSHVDAVVRVIDTDEQEKTYQTSLGGALVAGFFRLIWKGVVNDATPPLLEWPLRVNYVDASGNEYVRTFTIELDRHEMRARVLFTR